MKSSFCTTDTSLSFWDFNGHRIKTNIWNELSLGLWKDIDINAWLYNNTLPETQVCMQKPLFKNYYQISSGTKWNIKKQCLENDLYTALNCDCNLSTFLDMVGESLNLLNPRKIGVHLSGGLDSSIIICILKELQIPFIPIGLYSPNFEFRTEYHIQNILIEYGNDGELINLKDYPFYSNLDRLPRHQLPTCYINNNAGAEILSTKFAEKGCDVVFSGEGGDTLFVDEVPSAKPMTFNIRREFENAEEQEMYYGPKGIKLVSFFSNRQIINCLTTAAKGRREDASKLWARNFFSSILPPELVNYHYCGDFFGIALEGLTNAMPTIKTLFEEAYDLTQNPIFSPNVTKNFIQQDILSYEYVDYTKFCSLVAIAAWWHSLINT